MFSNSTDYELKPRYYAVVLLINSYYSHCNYKGGQVEWARPAVDSLLGNLGQAHAHVQRKTVPLPRCSKTYTNLSWRFPDTNRQTGQFCLLVIPLETRSPVAVKGWYVEGGETRGGQVSGSPVPPLFLSGVRSAPSRGWDPRLMLSRIPPVPSPS